MRYTLMQNQLGIFSAEQLTQDDSNYNLETMVKLDSSVDLDRLKKVVEDVIEAHPYVKSRLCHTEDGDVQLESHSDENFTVKVLEVADAAAAGKERNGQYDFFNDRLFRIEILKAPDGNYLYVNFSHLIFDGWSYRVFFAEVSKAYNGEALRVEENEIFELHCEEEEARKGEIYENEKAWFTNEFAPFDEVDSLPLSDHKEKEISFKEYVHSLHVREEVMDEFAKKAGTTRATLFMAAFALTLSKFSGDTKALFTTIYHGRKSETLKNDLAMLVKTIPAAVDIKDCETVEDLFKALRTQNLKARDSKAYGFTDLSRDLGIKSSILFAYQEDFHRFELKTDDKVSIIELGEAKNPGIDFCVQIFKKGEGYEASCVYPSSSYSTTLIENFFQSYDTILNEMLIKKDIKDIETAGSSQMKVIESLTTASFGENYGKESVTSLFRQCAQNYPDVTAVVYKNHRYSFKELDEMTDRLAAVILENIKDVKKDDQKVVSILISRNENMVIAPLAAMKAGCAYQPLDPAYPTERLNFMVKDADASLVIEEPAYADVLTEYTGRRLSTDCFEEIFKDKAPSVTLPDASPEDAMVLLYTSGSTGVPKGVILEQRNIITWCSWYNRYVDLEVGDNLACYASFGFDAHMSDIYPALTSGKTIHIIPEEIRLDLIALNQYFVENNVLSTLITTAVGTQFATNIEKSSLKYLLTGGEKLASIDPPTDYTLVNVYGPTETTITVTTKKVLEKEDNIPIGVSSETVKLYVVDQFMHRLPVGAPGELIIAGPQVGRGYLNRPEKNAEVFIENPFATESDAFLRRAYRTGDIVRFRENGDIEFVGRRDHQVKIHGYRIELKEVEAVIREFDGIKDATVQAFDDPNGGKYIAAYICGDEAIDIEAMNAFIASQKPSYMVPLVTMQIEKIPYNVNQKVDKKALPLPEFKTKSSAAGVSAPLNILEKELSALIGKILGAEEIGVADELTQVGLTSINSIKLSATLFNTYGITLNAFDLLDGATLQTIENKILQQWMSPDREEVSVLSESEKEVPFHKDNSLSAPLGFAQQGVYSECLSNPESTFYNISYMIRLPEGTKEEEVKEAVNALYEAHPALHSHFMADKDQNIIQMDMADHELSIPVLSMSAEELETYKKTFVKPFDLEKGPLAAFEIVKADGLYLLMSVHHLAADGASMDIMLNQLCEALDGKEIRKETYTCYDAALSESIEEENEAFFDEVMNGVDEASQLISDVYEKDLDHREGIVSVDTDLHQVMNYAKGKGVTPAAVYLSAAFLTIGRFICEDQVAIATISSGRSDVRLENTVGMFVNTLPLAIKLSNDEKVSDFIHRTAKLFTGVIRHEKHPFASIAAKYDFKPQISYAYQVGVLNRYETKLGLLETEDLGSDQAKIPVSIQIFGDEENGGCIQINFDTGLFTEGFARTFGRSMNNVVMELLHCEKVGDVSLTNAEDWKKLDSYNRPLKLDYDRNDTVVSKFKKVVLEFPDKEAAVYKDKSYTYRELDELTDRLSVCLYERLKKLTGKSNLAETVVSVIISRSEYVFILPLAILKAGCGYEPLDPSYPKERLNFMVKDAGASLLIAEESLAPLVDEYEGEVLLLHELEEEEKKLQDYTLPPMPKVHDLMIMLYTSGSTGTPKGCQIEHGNMVPFAYGSNQDGFYTTDGKTASFASFGFDVCMSDTFCTLLNGATLCVIPEDVRMNLNELADYFNEEGITQVLLTTQVGVQFVQNYPKMRTLRFLVMGGEKLPALNPDDLSYTIINGYGPTENCCGVSLFPIRFWEANVPIGKPLVTIAGYILDKSGHRLPAGAAGEYCLTGPQVSRGYLNRPDKTKEAYEASPFNEFRMYHTGDIVRYRENGDVEFVGRKDGQVKIRGFRVETKEVEAVIREYPSIEDATVQAYSYDNGGKYLAAFIVSDEKVNIDELNQFIKDRKPAYMVPLVTMQIDKIPLTVNQKVDKKALPKPEVKKAEYEAPKTKAEEDFCSFFSQILGVDKVGALDDFFELGGSSISAMRIVVAANQAGYPIVYQNIFENTTPRALAVFAGGENINEVVAKEIVRENKSGESFYGEGTTEIGQDGYDYRDINALLRGNTVEAFRNGEMQEVKDVLLLGATGYLGIHVFKQLLDRTEGRIYCLTRAKKDKSGEERFKELLNYYFGEDFGEFFGSRVFVVEGDATDASSLKQCQFKEQHMTVINCAASVKHFSKGNEIEKANLETVRNLIGWCLENEARLVHVSTESVFGHPSNGMPRDGLIYDEHMLFVGQVYEDNQYVRSKFLAEREIYENILKNGLNAKVLRAGNLAPRSTDGHFQVNASTNNFMNTLKGFKVLSMVPYDVSVTSTEFSPIDKVAEAVFDLAKTPRACVTFMMSNNHRPLMGDVIEGMKHYGMDIHYAESDEFGQALNEALQDPARCDAMQPFMAYALNGTTEASSLGLDALSVSYTTQILARFGFRWPVCGEEYYQKFLNALNGFE